MKKVFVLLLMCCIGCGENKENRENTDPSGAEAARDSINAQASSTPEKAFLCFFATQNGQQSQEVRDSIILNLELTGEVVTGNFNWIPAEKDSRRGVIQATKTGDEVKGNYAFTQEGVQDTVFIEIQLQNTSAVVTTLSENGEEMTMQVERVDCQ